MTNKNIELTESGLKCDNPQCDWEDKTIPHTEYEKYIDVSCPKCGENILTEEDFKLAEAFHFAVDLINNMSEEQINQLYGEIDTSNLFSAEKETEQNVTVKVGLHNQVTFEIEENDRDSNKRNNITK